MNIVWKIILGVITLVLLWETYVFFFKQKVVITNYPSKNTEIVAFGDSLIQGIGATKDHDLVSLLSNKINQPITNLGVSGNTTRNGLERIHEVLERKPKVTIILLGGNDYLRQLPQEETFKNLESIIRQVQSTGSIVLLLGVRGGVFSDHFEKQFEMLAQKTGSAYVSDVLDGLLGDKKYMSDAIHPNDIGYAIIADRVEPVLTNLLK